MLVTIVIVVYTHNLAIGIFAGVLLSMIVFFAKASKIEFSAQGDTIEISGQLFASAASFIAYF